MWILSASPGGGNGASSATNNIQLADNVLSPVPPVTNNPSIIDEAGEDASWASPRSYRWYIITIIGRSFHMVYMYWINVSVSIKCTNDW